MVSCSSYLLRSNHSPARYSVRTVLLEAAATVCNRTEDSYHRATNGEFLRQDTTFTSHELTPESVNRKKLPIPDSQTPPNFSPHGLTRYRIVCVCVCVFVCLFVYQSTTQSKLRVEPKAKTSSSLLQEEIHGSAFHRSVSLSENLDRRPKYMELGTSSSEYSLALPLRCT